METSDLDNQKIHDSRWDDSIDMKVYGPASRWLRSMIRSSLKQTDEATVKTILDFGCGEGTITDLLANRFPSARIIGTDFSITGIEAASRRYRRENLQFLHDVEGDALSKSYDLITCFEVLEHVPDWENVLGRLANASNQWLLLSFPTGRMREFERDIGHFRNFQHGQVEEFLRGFGYEEVLIRYAGFPFYSPLYRNLCNRARASTNPFTRGKYGFRQKALGTALFTMFRCLSTQHRWGDQFLGLFEKAQANGSPKK